MRLMTNQRISGELYSHPDQQWAIEMNSSATLARLGWTRKTLIQSPNPADHLVAFSSGQFPLVLTRLSFIVAELVQQYLFRRKEFGRTRSLQFFRQTPSKIVVEQVERSSEQIKRALRLGSRMAVPGRHLCRSRCIATITRDSDYMSNRNVNLSFLVPFGAPRMKDGKTVPPLHMEIRRGV
jgi:hypothetical protein